MGGSCNKDKTIKNTICFVDPDDETKIKDHFPDLNININNNNHHVTNFNNIETNTNMNRENNVNNISKSNKPEKENLTTIVENKNSSGNNTKVQVSHI